MRVASLSFFLYSLSLVAVVAGQSTQLTDSITDVLPTPTDSSTTDSEPTETSTTETSETSTTSEDEPTTTSTSTTTSDEETSTTESTTTTSDPTTTTTTTTEPTSTSTSTSTDSNNDDDEPTSTASVTTITTTQTIDGTPVPTTFTSTNSESSEATESPGLSGSSDDSDSGLSSNQKNIIIGVVVGVGGAILIGAIGVVAWRIRARRRNAQDDDVTDLMSGTAVGSGVREKAPSPAAGGTPFRSTLDQYHNPGPVNAASNF
ncbi:hypothetical protein BJX65DRAFT_77796 [Aspergillus insuetus]